MTVSNSSRSVLQLCLEGVKGESRRVDLDAGRRGFEAESLMCEDVSARVFGCSGQVVASKASFCDMSEALDSDCSRSFSAGGGSYRVAVGLLKKPLVGDCPSTSNTYVSDEMAYVWATLVIQGAIRRYLLAPVYSGPGVTSDWLLASDTSWRARAILTIINDRGSLECSAKLG